MAKPIEPDRWEEFPSRRAARSTPRRPGPPPDAARSVTKEGSATSDRSASTARSAGWVVADFGVRATGDEPPIPVVAGLVGQIAAQATQPAQAGQAGQPGQGVGGGGDLDVDQDQDQDQGGAITRGTDPRGLTVESSGQVGVPSSFTASGSDLLMLFAELIGDQPVPPSIARLLLTKPETEVGQLSTALEPLGSATEVAEFMVRRDKVEGVAGVGDRGVGEDLSQPESPIADRAAGSGMPDAVRRGAGPFSGRDRPAVGSGGASAGGVGRGGVRRNIVAAVGALAVIAVGAMVLVGGESSSTADVELTTPAPVVPDQNPPPSPVAVVAGTDSPPSPSPEAEAEAEGVGSTSRVTPYPTSWAALLAKLDSSRAVAFSTGKKQSLADVNIAGSPAARVDEQMLDDLQQIGALAQGLGSKIDDVQVISESASESRLAVTDVLGAYQIVTKVDGSVIESRKQRAQRSWEVTLRPVDGQWRIYQAAPR